MALQSWDARVFVPENLSGACLSLDFSLTFEDERFELIVLHSANKDNHKLTRPPHKTIISVVGFGRVLLQFFAHVRCASVVARRAAKQSHNNTRNHDKNSRLMTKNLAKMALKLTKMIDLECSIAEKSIYDVVK